jgi:hypothetical protein
MWSFQETVQLTPAQFILKVRRSIGFRAVKYLNDWRRDRFRRVSPERYIREYSTHALPGVHVYTLCGAASLQDEVLSMLSFLRHTGIPESWMIASDGSLTPEMEKTLLDLHPVVRIVPWRNFITEENREGVEYFAAKNPMGKKMAVVTALPTEHISVYIDSDILFFPGAFHLRDLLLNGPRDNYYVEEWARWFPAGFLSPEEEALPPLNAGFLIQGRPVDWTESFARLGRVMKEHPEPEETLGQVSLLIEQTVVQIAYHRCGAKILDPKQYIINNADAWKLRDEFAHPDRDYLSYLRPKLYAEAKHYYR